LFCDNLLPVLMNFMQIHELVRELRVRCASTLSRGEDVAHGSGDCNGEKDTENSETGPNNF